MKDRLIYVIIGVVICLMLVSGYNHLFKRQPAKPERLGTVTIEGTVKPALEDVEVEIRPTFKIEHCDYQRSVESVGDSLRWHDFEVKHQLFGIKGSVLGLEVKEIRIKEVRYRGEGEIWKQNKDVKLRPITEGLTMTYASERKLSSPEPWIHFDLILASQVFPPYHVFIAAGAGINRLPLIGKLPDITIGPCVIVDQLGVFIAKRW